MHPRRPHAEKPPLGDQGEVARRSRDGGDQKRRGPEAYNPSVSLRLTAPFAQGSLFSQASRTCGSADCLAHGSWRADVGIGPYEGNRRTAVRIGTRFRAAIQAPSRYKTFPAPNRGRIVVCYTYRCVTTSMTPRVVRRRVGITGRA